MKKIKLKMSELNNPQILTTEQLKNVVGGSTCYTGMTCGLGGDVILLLQVPSAYALT